MSIVNFVDLTVQITRLLIIVPFIAFVWHYLRQYGRRNGLTAATRAALLQLITGVTALLIYMFVSRVGSLANWFNPFDLWPSIVVLFIQMYIIYAMTRCARVLKTLTDLERREDEE